MNCPNTLLTAPAGRSLHPELQAELEFGVEQSKGTSLKDFKENPRCSWPTAKTEIANEQIIAKRAAATQSAFPAMADLQNVVELEIEYQQQLWQSDFEAAMGTAEAILARLTSPALGGYRALWHYLAGSAAWLGAKAGNAPMQSKSKAQFAAAKTAAPMVPWLVALARFVPANSTGKDQSVVLGQVGRPLEAVLTKLGKLHDRGFDRREKEILDGLPPKTNLNSTSTQVLGRTARLHCRQEGIRPRLRSLVDRGATLLRLRGSCRSAADIVPWSREGPSSGGPPAVDQSQHTHIGKRHRDHPCACNAGDAGSAGSHSPSRHRYGLPQLPEFVRWAKTALSEVRTLRREFWNRAIWSGAPRPLRRSSVTASTPGVLRNC